MVGNWNQAEKGGNDGMMGISWRTHKWDGRTHTKQSESKNNTGLFRGLHWLVCQANARGISDVFRVVFRV